MLAAEGGALRPDFVGRDFVPLDPDGEGMPPRFSATRSRLERSSRGRAIAADSPKTLTFGEFPFNPPASACQAVHRGCSQLGQTYIGNELLLVGKKGQSIAANIPTRSAPAREVRQETCLARRRTPLRRSGRIRGAEIFARDLTTLARETKLDVIGGRARIERVTRSSPVAPDHPVRMASRAAGRRRFVECRPRDREPRRSRRALTSVSSRRPGRARRGHEV